MQMHAVSHVRVPPLILFFFILSILSVIFTFHSSPDRFSWATNNEAKKPAENGYFFLPPDFPDPRTFCTLWGFFWRRVARTLLIPNSLQIATSLSLLFRSAAETCGHTYRKPSSETATPRRFPMLSTLASIVGCPVARPPCRALHFVRPALCGHRRLYCVPLPGAGLECPSLPELHPLSP